MVRTLDKRASVGVEEAGEFECACMVGRRRVTLTSGVKVDHNEFGTGRGELAVKLGGGIDVFRHVGSTRGGVGGSGVCWWRGNKIRGNGGLKERRGECQRKQNAQSREGAEMRDWVAPDARA